MSTVFVRRVMIHAVVASVMLVTLGCGKSSPGLYDVTGTVTYQGKPLPSGTIRFVPFKGRPSAPVPIGSDGRFNVQLPQGECRVEIKAVEKPVVQSTAGQQQIGFEGETLNTGPPPKWLIPKKYGRFDTSGVTIVVEAEKTNSLDIPLE